MTFKLPKISFPFVKKAAKPVVFIHFLTEKETKDWLKKQDKTAQNQVKSAGFSGNKGETLILKDNKGQVDKILAGISEKPHYLESATAAQAIQKELSKDFISKHVFEVAKGPKTETLTKIAIGWGLAAYTFDQYKKNDRLIPVLLWPAKADEKEARATIEGICTIRNLINTPPNILGTDELARAAKDIAETHKAKFKVIKGEELKKQNFPMIYAVGQASPRKPQLVDIKWGKAKDPKVTIVGKGIIYDTGGLNLKPPQAMRDMKKDMGGAAHALGLASMIMALKLPVNLRVLLPIAENAVSGNSYRPGDVLTSRKGITVEIDDTDAEGRLVVADALTYASEDKPGLLIDYCTLTGAARVALGYDIPAFFSNNEDFIDDLRHLSLKQDDPVWPLPLWDGYEKEMDSNVADLINNGKGRAGAIHGGLFLQRFVDPSIDWIHLDCYAWEQNGKPGRPQGGADTGMRALFHFIKNRYS
jgi:leucyl aminopeptidase